MSTPVYLEVGKTKVFACAVDWPGWERSGKTEEAALDALATYAGRYAPIAGRTRLSTSFEVVERLPGTGATDFGVIEARSAADHAPLPKAWPRILAAAWDAFDATVARSSAELRKGPRGGGRDRDAIVDHVQEAERSYARSIGVKLPPRTPWAEQRVAILDALPSVPLDAKWPPRYFVRRTTWHVVDHLWEIEDKQT